MIATASAISSTGAIPVPVECGFDHLIENHKENVSKILFGDKK